MTVVMPGMREKLHMAVFLRTMLTSLFQLQSDMTDPVLSQLLPDSLLDVPMISVCHNVHGGIVVLTVHTPNMNVVDI